MKWLADLLKDIPISEIQRERLQLAAEKHEFEISRLQSERDDFKLKYEKCQKDHALCKSELDDARAAIQNFNKQPKKTPEINIRNTGGRIPRIC